MRVGTPALIEIIGVDGSEWTVSGPGAGAQGVELAMSPQGLHDEAPIKGIWQQSAFQHGATYVGHTIEPLDMILPFNVMGAGGWDWQYNESRFHMAWDEVMPTTVRVTVDGVVRYLEVVKLENIRTTSAQDPRLLQKSVMTVTVRAPWPFWKGDTVISSASTTSNSADLTVTVANPTDTAMWVEWVLTAPGRWVLPDFSWKNDDHHNHTVPTPKLRAGEDLTIHTYPLDEPYVADNGSNIAGRFGGVLFQHSIPPHTPPTDVPVLFREGSGGGAVQCRMHHNWKRAWGGQR